MLRQVCVPSLLGIAILLGAAPRAFAAPRALILFDGKAEATAESYTNARFTANLLGHFDVAVELRPVDRYHKGDLLAFDFVFYGPGTPRPKFPNGFLDEMARRQGPTVWM